MILSVKGAFRTAWIYSQLETVRGTINREEETTNLHIAFVVGNDVGDVVLDNTNKSRVIKVARSDPAGQLTVPDSSVT